LKRGLIIGGVILLLAVIVVASMMGGDDKGERVYAEEVGRKDIETIVSAPGEIDPKVKVNISAHVIGKIEKLYFDEGDVVQRGQKMVELERVAYEAQQERVRAELAGRNIELRRAEINLAQSELDLKRTESLRQQGIQTEERYERARLDYENARANLAAAREGVRQAQAALAQAADDVSRTTILAPMDGQVVQLNAREGEVVVTGTMNNPGSVIAVLADLSEVLVVAEVGENEVVQIRPGLPARVSVDAVGDRTYRGSVVEIGSSAAARAGAGAGLRFFRVKIIIEDPDERLRPGMTAQVEIVVSAREGVLSVPVQSVLERELENQGAEGEQKVVPVVADGRVKMVPVETGISDATHVEIVGGIEEGESVITGPFRTLRRLKDGERVVVREESQDEEQGDR
jgi:HlyD family secretion protein